MDSDTQLPLGLMDPEESPSFSLFIDCSRKLLSNHYSSVRGTGRPILLLLPVMWESSCVVVRQNQFCGFFFFEVPNLAEPSVRAWRLTAVEGYGTRYHSLLTCGVQIVPGYRSQCLQKWIPTSCARSSKKRAFWHLAPIISLLSKGRI